MVVYHAMTSRLRGSSLLNPQSCRRSPPSPNPPQPASGRGFAPVIKPSRDMLTSKITFAIGLPPGHLDCLFMLRGRTQTLIKIQPKEYHGLKVYRSGLMLLVVMSNDHVSELLMQLVPLV